MFSIKPTFSTGLLCAAAFSLLPLSASAQRIIDFGDLSLAEDSFYKGADGAGGFSSGGAFFNNHYETTDWGDFWGGWSYSNVNDTETAGFLNQYAAFTGTGIGPSGVYGVAYVDTWTPTIPRIALPEGERISSLQITNTTYSALSMMEGDGFADPFSEGSFFYLTIAGFTAANDPTDSVDFYLADFRSEDNSLWYILNDWASVDLSGFGADTRALEFTLTSSDPGTPTYFALGEMTVIPEPGTYALLVGLAMGVGVCVLRLRGRKGA